MPSVKETQDYFENRAELLQKDNLIDKWAFLNSFISELPDGARILECGSGTGLYTIPLLELGHKVVSVDLSQNCLDQIRNMADNAGYGDNLTTVTGEFIECVDELGGKFDAVTFFKVLHHFPDQGAIKTALVKSYSVLEKDGKILIFEPNGSCPLWEILLRARGKEHWENEKNYRLIREKFFSTVFSQIPKAIWKSSYRYFIPGSIIKRFAFLDIFDRIIVSIPILKSLAGNILFVVEKR